MITSGQTSRYKIFFIKDERGNTSHHYAETKNEAIKAHIEHWGYEGLRTEPRIIELMKTDVPVCTDKTCLETANIPTYALVELRRK